MKDILVSNRETSSIRQTLQQPSLDADVGLCRAFEVQDFKRDVTVRKLIDQERKELQTVAGVFETF